MDNQIVSQQGNALLRQSSIVQILLCLAKPTSNLPDIYQLKISIFINHFSDQYFWYTATYIVLFGNIFPSDTELQCKVSPFVLKVYEDRAKYTLYNWTYPYRKKALPTINSLYSAGNSCLTIPSALTLGFRLWFLWLPGFFKWVPATANLAT